ncbi:MAG: class I SAM-dependent methyltransferase [Polyangiaceae bacterium]|nr:class I SAM-dependent methyltransferase [Polyangiaceae bacterium]
MPPSTHLAQAFEAADPDHFAWQTEGAYIAERERELCRAAFLPLGSSVLDLGCGEGATLHHLGAPDGAVGVDLFPSKIEFARQRLPGCRFVVASVCELPFESQSFDHLVVRDLIHHLDEPERFIEECARMVIPGGRIDILEPCRNNPLIFLHAITNRAERGELRSTARFLEGLVKRRFRVVSTQRLQPLPIHRLVFHPKLGLPALARTPIGARSVEIVENLAQYLMPRSAWAYIHVRAVAPSSDTR